MDKGDGRPQGAPIDELKGLGKWATITTHFFMNGGGRVNTPFLMFFFFVGYFIAILYSKTKLHHIYTFKKKIIIPA